MPRVWIYHNLIAPYRLPIFEELSRIYDTEVHFLSESTSDRPWSIKDIRGYKFRNRVVANRRIGPLVINSSLPIDILKKRPDITIAGENPANCVSIVLGAVATKLIGGRFLIWSEVIRTDWSSRQIGTCQFFLLKLYRNILYGLADGFIAYSKMAKRFLVESGISEKRIFTGPQTYPTELIESSSTRKPDLSLNRKKVILYLGYLRRGKGVDVLIRAFNTIGQEDAVLIIAGSGESEVYLKKLAEGNDSIQFTGHVAGKEKAKCYSNADIFVLPTLYDAWGLVVNEAMSYGLPIIVTSAAGASEIISGNGFVIPPNDEKALKEALEVLLREDDLREKMGRESKRTVSRIDLRTGTKPFVDAIEFVRELGLRTRGKEDA